MGLPQRQAARGTAVPIPAVRQIAYRAVRSATPVRRSGELADPIWAAVDTGSFCLPGGRGVDAEPQEGGTVAFAWDRDHLHLGLRLEDSDLVCEADGHGVLMNKLGDTCELMLRPPGQTYYWEFHVTPAGLGASFFFPGRGRVCLPSCCQPQFPLKVHATCEGTLNDWRDRDTGWSAQMSIPFEALGAHGEIFSPDRPWQFLVGRYNYSRFLSTRGPELSTFPRISAADFHRLEEYGWLELQP